MKTKILRILGVIGLAIGMGSLSACFEESYHPGYAYGRPAYAYPQSYPRYYPEYVPVPRSYAYNAHPYAAKPHANWRSEREEHQEYRGRAHHHDHDRF